MSKYCLFLIVIYYLTGGNKIKYQSGFLLCSFILCFTLYVLIKRYIIKIISIVIKALTSFIYS